MVSLAYSSKLLLI